MGVRFYIDFERDLTLEESIQYLEARGSRITDEDREWMEERQKLPRDMDMGEVFERIGYNSLNFVFERDGTSCFCLGKNYEWLFGKILKERDYLQIPYDYNGGTCNPAEFAATMEYFELTTLPANLPKIVGISWS